MYPTLPAIWYLLIPINHSNGASFQKMASAVSIIKLRMLSHLVLLIMAIFAKECLTKESHATRSPFYAHKPHLKGKWPSHGA